VKYAIEVKRGLSVAVLHQPVIDDFIADPVTNHLLVLRELVVPGQMIISCTLCNAQFSVAPCSSPSSANHASITVKVANR